MRVWGRGGRGEQVVWFYSHDSFLGTLTAGVSVAQ